MKTTKYVLFASMLMASMAASAQETYQDTKVAQSQLNGTARYVGMGGAMEALGADISTIATNPAGVGLLSRSSVSISAGVVGQSDDQNNKSQLFDNSSYGKKTHASFDQVGIVWALNNRSRNHFNIAFNYHKDADLGQILTAANSLNGASQNYLTAIKHNYGSENICCTSLDENYFGGSTGNGLLNKYQDATGTNWLLSEGADKFGYRQYQHGYIGEYDFNISGSFSNRVWVGLTVGLHDVHYHSSAEYAEALQDGNYVHTSENLAIKGTGFDIKAGVIFRPIETSPFRIGLYVNTPVFYDLDLSAASSVTMDGSNSVATLIPEGSSDEVAIYNKGMNRNSSTNSFRLNTPWKVGVSLGHTVGNYLAIGATYEYAWYSHMDNRMKDGGYYDAWSGAYYSTSSSDNVMNQHTRASLNGVSTLKVGLEYKPAPFFALRLGYNYVSPLFKENAYRDGSLDCDGSYFSTSTDYTNWKAINRFTVGVGYNYRKFSLDLAYQYNHQNGDFYPFMSYSDGENYNVAKGTKVQYNRHQLLVTLGYKF